MKSVTTEVVTSVCFESIPSHSTVVYLFFAFFFFFFFVGPHLWHMEVPRLEVVLELWLLAYPSHSNV